MSLTSNYTRKDWSEVGLAFSVSLVLPFIFTLFILFDFLLPLIDMMPDVVPYFVDDEFVVNIRDGLLEKGYGMNEILVYYIFTVSGALVIPIIILLFLMNKSLALGYWAYKKWFPCNKDCTIFWNGIPTSETKWGKRLKRVNDYGKKKKD